MKNVKSNKGITLIALVITIIILLILAGISIATLTGENGLLTKANTAKTETKKANAEEQVKIAVAGSFDDGGELTADKVKEELGKIPDVGEIRDTNGGFPIEVDLDGYIFVIDGNGSTRTAEIFSDIYTSTQAYTDGSKTAVIPEGFAVGISSTINKIDNGLVITDAIDENHKSTGNEFVWVPVEDFDDFIRVSGYYNGNPQTCTFTTTGLTSGQYYEPVGDGIANTTEAEKMYKSVKNNKGFYIGRYEAGNEGGTFNSTTKEWEGNSKVVVKKNKTVYNNVKWGTSMADETGGAVELAKNFVKTTYTDNNKTVEVTSTLIYGVQWDTTLKFFNDETYLKNSKGKGWYSDNYSTGNPNHLTGIDVDSNASNKVKNIYDMAGNVYEWTMEAYYTYLRVVRGGYYGRDGGRLPASYRDGGGPTSSSDYVGFRLALYVNV